MSKHLFLPLAFLLLTSCQQAGKPLPTPDRAMEAFEAFKQKEKFVADQHSFYPGPGDPAQLPRLIKLMNLAADDFQKVATADNPTDKKYQQQIGIGLSRFTPLLLDTEDQEAVCYYFEELMDIVGLESSDGQLNEFRYGFDISKLER